jgi:DUF971 family protein
MPISRDPEHIAISKSSGVTIDWKDGHKSSYSLELLRDKCPCATCAGTHGTPPRQPAPDGSPFQMFRPALRMLSAEPVGRYAIRIHWNDGHSAGIYSHNYLRELCPCPACVNSDELHPSRPPQ